jgi:TonB-linked SusC/RagA family outer membrane protein
MIKDNRKRNMKKNNKTYIILFAALLMAFSGMAQTRINVRGTVTAKSDKLALIGVSVAEYDNNNRILNGTITDFDGNYTLKISGTPGNKISFSYVGYKPVSRAIGTSREIDIQMEDATQTIKEVSVTARRQMSTGIVNIAERDLTFAMSKIETKDLEGLQVASIDEALQGRMSGVDIVANSGEPGAGMSIRIRGTTSINNGSDPLIVVDGIPYDTNIGSDFDFATADEDNYAQLLNISPADIQEISVLKDAAATAMYGNRGANGVLLIKTKRGVYGVPTISYTFKGSANTPAEPIKTLNGDQYTTLILEASQNSGNPLSTFSFPQFTYDPNDPFYYYNYGQNTDWYSALTKTGFTQDHSISLSGGGEKATYRTSLGYYDQTGTVIGMNYSRITASLNLDYNVSDRLRFQVNMSYTSGNQDKNYTADLLNSAYTKMPNQSIYEYNTLGEMTPNYFSPEFTPQGNWNSFDYGKSKYGIYNPVSMANNGYWKIRSERILPKFNLQYWIIPEVLRYQADLAFDINTSKDTRFLPQIATGRVWPELSVNRSNDLSSESFVVQTFNRMYFTPKLGEKHDLIGLVQLSTYDAKYSSYQEISALSASTFLKDPSVSSQIVGGGLGLFSGSSQSRALSMLGMLQYKYLDRYIINGTLRRDGDSKYSQENRYGYFPSVSVRYRVSNEPFMKGIEQITDFSIRLSSGMSGNPVDKNYLYYNNYGTYDATYLDEQGVYSKGLQLSNLKWEKVTDFNIGGNLIMFDNRMNIDFNWYKKRTNDLYFKTVNIPSTSGFSSIGMNVGIMDNRGWELSLNTTPLKSKDLQIDFNFNFARSENEIVSLSDNIPLLSTPSPNNGTYLTKIQVGNPLGSFYGYKYDGVYLNESQTIAKDKNGNAIYTYDENGNKEAVKMKFWYPSVGYEFQPGDAKYVDVNNDGNINSQDIVYLGDVNPLLTGGFGPTIRWKKKLTLTAYFYYRYGFEVINQTRMEMENMHGFNNQSTSVLKRWRHPYEDEASAPDDLLPRALRAKGYNWLGSDRYVEDGSFLRFKSITLSYNFDREIVKKLGLNDVRFWFTVQNIYLWTNYTGMDPEVSMRSGLNDLGKDNSRSGRPREYSLGFSTSF